MQTEKCRVLCVDDHEDTSFMLTHLLGQSNYEVVTARSIAEALGLVERENFDLYVLDKRLPDGTGLELCERLSVVTPRTPVIFYSGDAYAIHRHQGLSAGAAAYVTKPSIEELISTVQRILSEKDCAAAV